MKKLIVILGPNGVGKSTTAKTFLERNAGCAYVDAIVFPYAFHGERKEIFDAVIGRLKEDGIDFKVFTIVLRCSLEENRRRCELDGRDVERTERGIKNTFHFYYSFDGPTITTTDLSPEEVAGRIAEMIE